MSSKADLKRAHIIHTAIQYLKEHDLHTLTLDKIAQKANISKGGLLYHFKSKDELYSAIAQTIMTEFVDSFEAITQLEHGTGKRTRGFILASQKDYEDGAWINIAIQIIQNDNHSISIAYEQLLESLLHDGLEPSIVHMIRLTIDGLYYSKLLNIAPVSKQVTETVFDQLLQMTRKDDQT
ncbi:TetR/AcrR family transcriptional regulator [Lysinibacillus sp. FSL W8-0992]|uniref:TetR/AcrR family transcriptional regulator n=1 Tax=Lysinibacillus sp. FSL W8-0992 TaxID=2954643 RepID=UPI0030F73EF1